MFILFVRFCVVRLKGPQWFIKIDPHVILFHFCAERRETGEVCTNRIIVQTDSGNLFTDNIVCGGVCQTRDFQMFANSISLRMSHFIR